MPHTPEPLTVAAPELLASLKSILEICQNRWRSLPADSHEKKCIAQAKDAIAKAEGRS